jgi:hypothetical protein
MLNIVIGWKSGCGRIWSWHAFRMVCCHTVLSMHMAEVRCVWYCVTLVVGGGNDVMMACWNVCRLSDSLSSPQALCRSWRLVISVPVALLLDQLFGRVWMRDLMW